MSENIEVAVIVITHSLCYAITYQPVCLCLLLISIACYLLSTFFPTAIDVVQEKCRIGKIEDGLALSATLFPVMFLTEAYPEAKQLFLVNNLCSVLIFCCLWSMNLNFNSAIISFGIICMGLVYAIAIEAVTGTVWFTLNHPFLRPSSYLTCYCNLVLVIFILIFLLSRLPRSFSLAEVVFISNVLAAVLLKFSKVSLRKDAVLDDLGTWALAAGMFTILLMPYIESPDRNISAYRPQRDRSVETFLFLQLSVAVVFTYTYLLEFLEKDPISWIVNFLLMKRNAIELFVIWALMFGTCVALAMFVPFDHISKGAHKTRLRKLFHLAVVSVFLSGLLVNARVLYLASSLCICVFVVVEFIRANQLTVLSSILNDKLSNFIDEQDSGPLYLTPIYLLISMCFPLWIHSGNINDRSLLLFSGILSVGIGDTVASIYGSKYGKVKIPGNKKSLDATLIATLSILVFTWLLVESGAVVMTISWFSYAFVSLLTMLLEFSTKQIDNLVLAPFFYSLIKILSV